MNLELIANNLLNDISTLIDTARLKVANYANASLVQLYWNVGKIISHNILNEERGKYGEKIIHHLSQGLMQTYGRGFSSRSLFKMVQFYKIYNDEEILPTLSAQLSWSHLLELIVIDEDLKRKFYMEMCRIERWSVRELRRKISGMLYERTAISQRPENVIKHELSKLEKNNELTKDLVFRDPYILEFLQLPADFSESDLENAILDDLTRFLSELGTDFCFIARQKRITIDSDDYYIDILAFHRTMKRLIAIELKLGAFKPSYKGQMELYLRWLDKYERKPGEEPPLGLILCASKKQEQIQLLELDKSGIHVAEYLTQLPPKEALEARLHRAIAAASESNPELSVIENADEIED